MEVKTFHEIRDAMRNYIVSHQDRITDFNDGSVIESQTEAVARELAMLYIRARVGFSSHLRGLPYSVFGFTMKAGVKASVTLVFSRAKAYSNDTTIPAGVIVSSGSLRFLTTEAGTVKAGETASNEITASAEDVGEKYNVGAASIKTIVSTLPADIVEVKNPDAATGGADSEDWSAYIARFSEYILGLSRTNGFGFQSALTSSNLARSISIIEHFPPADGLWNMTVYLEDGSGGMTNEALAQAKTIIDGDGTKENGGFRAPGVNIRYLTPEKVPVSVAVEVTAERDVVNEIAESAITSEVAEAVKKFINSYKIGIPLILSDLIVELKRIQYLFDVEIHLPADNIPISDSQIARFESCDVKVVIK